MFLLLHLLLQQISQFKTKHFLVFFFDFFFNFLLKGVFYLSSICFFSLKFYITEKLRRKIIGESMLVTLLRTFKCVRGAHPCFSLTHPKSFECISAKLPSFSLTLLSVFKCVSESPQAIPPKNCQIYIKTHFHLNVKLRDFFFPLF